MNEVNVCKLEHEKRFYLFFYVWGITYDASGKYRHVNSAVFFNTVPHNQYQNGNYVFCQILSTFLIGWIEEYLIIQLSHVKPSSFVLV